ncbi:hypothetical protein AVEN_230117-1 [Araneus ventricosus]|uniref:Uncharacterized protein n=1 Tax=Araneus ventricosus TaxID=182803 RepID=A0A4Y2NXZ4_ARAVE|nr:hypothetical protein AVEN_230117-1 [Araneus ventricosus]
MGKIRFFRMFACPFECLPLSLENANFNGNCYLLNLDNKSFGVIGIRGIKTLSHLTMPVITVARTTFGHSLSEGIPDNSKELKNSTGYDVTCYSPLAYLQIDIL